MKRYDNYKDSGVQWIGEIPSHWEVCRVKHRYNLVTGFTPDTKRLDFYDESNGETWVTIADISGKFIDDSSKYISDKYIKEFKPQKVVKGSLLYSFKLSVGQVAFASKDLYTNEAIASFLDTNRVCLPFMYYAAPLFIIENANTNIYGAKILNQDLINNAFTIFPPLEEQKAIAEWLDVKCGEIDKLIATQQRRIELLQELRQSIITRAVTRGINPDAPLRDSGIDWIGQVPSHWEISKMNYVCDVITDYVASGSFADLKVNVTYLDEPDYAMLVRTADLSQKNKDVAKVYVSKQSYDFLSNSNLFGGEIILPNIGASIGDVYMVPIDLYDKMTLAPNSIMVKTKWCDLFYFYYFKSVCGRKSLELIGQAAAQGKFNKTELRQLRLPLPPLSEQREIVTHIKHETAKVDHALQQAERQIELLQELRQSVITEVVTGKRKVC